MRNQRHLETLRVPLKTPKSLEFAQDSTGSEIAFYHNALVVLMTRALDKDNAPVAQGHLLNYTSIGDMSHSIEDGLAIPAIRRSTSTKRPVILNFG